MHFFCFYLQYLISDKQEIIYQVGDDRGIDLYKQSPRTCIIIQNKIYPRLRTAITFDVSFISSGNLIQTLNFYDKNPYSPLMVDKYTKQILSVVYAGMGNKYFLHCT